MAVCEREQSDGNHEDLHNHEQQAALSAWQEGSITVALAEV